MFGLITLGCSGDRQTNPPRSLNHGQLDTAIAVIAQRVRPGEIGVAVRDLATNDTWSFAGSDRFPMQSVFKLPLGAALLDAVSRGALSLSDTVTLTPADLSPPYSPIGAAFPGRTKYTVHELLVAAVGGSDNTAADVLMKLIGGPEAVTRWLSSKGVTELRVDRYEREFQIELNGMPPFQPEWHAESVFVVRLEAVPKELRHAAMMQYLDDPRDTSTPLGAIGFLEKLEREELLPPTLTSELLRIATETTTGARRLKAGLPAGAVIAHKTGTARPDHGINPAINDIGIVRLTDGRRIAIAVFLAASPLPFAEAETVLADVMRAVLGALR